MVEATDTQLIVEFEVEGLAVPKQRARVSTDRNGNTHAYYANRSRNSKRLSYPEYMQLVIAQCTNALRNAPGYYGGADIVGCYRIEVDSYRTSLQGDWDNLGGTFSDALQGLIWCDDKQIIEGEVKKFLVKRSKDCRVVIRVLRVRIPGLI